MKKKIIFIGLLCCFACKKKPYDTSMYYIPEKDTVLNTISLIKHPYIFEEQEIKLESFFYQKKRDTLILQAKITGNITKYNNSFIYFHAYTNTTGNEFINMDLPLVNNDNQLLYKRKVVLQNKSFPEIRYGLAIKAKERIVSLSLKNVQFKNND